MHNAIHIKDQLKDYNNLSHIRNHLSKFGESGSKAENQVDRLFNKYCNLTEKQKRLLLNLSPGNTPLKEMSRSRQLQLQEMLDSSYPKNNYSLPTWREKSRSQSTHKTRNLSAVKSLSRELSFSVKQSGDLNLNSSLKLDENC